MKTVYIFFSTDAWNSNKQMILVGSTRNKGMKLLRDWITKNRVKPLNEEELEFLERNNQTQGRECNFQIEPTELNTIVG
jgi:hypothetical protein